MIIQRILSPDNNALGLYYKELDSLKREKTSSENISNNITFPIGLKRGHIYSFGTYVNSLIIDRWTSCSVIDSITIKIRTTGSIKVQVYNSTGAYNYGDTIRASAKCEIDASVFCEERKEYNEYIIELDDINYSGIIYPIIEAREDCMLLGGEYTTNIPIEVSQVKPVAIINYNKDANITGHNIKTIEKHLNGNVPIVVCDMTGNLNEHSLTDGTNDDSVTIIKSNEKPGNGYNKALDYLRSKYNGEYTHVIMIDYNVEINADAIERLLIFISLLDDVRNDMIIQGDVLRDGVVDEGSGYIVRDVRGYPRFQDFDMTKSEDYVAYASYDEMDYFKLGLVCIPLSADMKFGDYLLDNVEFDYYLRYKPISLVSLNGFFGVRRKCSNEGIIKSYYYRYRDDFIARTDSDLELSKIAFKTYLDTEIKREIKRGNFELAFTIIDATYDFLKGPKVLEEDEDTQRKIKERTKRFNDNIIGRKVRIRDRIKLEQEYNKLTLKIDRDYDIIIEDWQNVKRNEKAVNER